MTVLPLVFHVSRFGIAFALAMSSFGGGATAARADDFSMPMAEDALVMTYTYKPHGEMKIAAMIAPIDGKVAVCAFWTQSGCLSPYVKSTGLLSQSRGTSVAP